MARKILVVDDELKMVKLITTYLRNSGFSVITAYDGQQALSVFRVDQPDLVVLDLMLPEVEGLDVARTIRRESDVPIIMLTARADETDRLIGLELGADDYIVKPFSPRELVARIRAVLRRATNSKMEKAEGIPPPRITVGSLSIDLDKREVVLARQHIRLTAIQFDLLAFLGSHPGRVFTRMQLLAALRGQASECYERTIDAHIKNLRRALGDDPRNPKHILTVHGVGYKLLEPEACHAN